MERVCQIVQVVPNARVSRIVQVVLIVADLDVEVLLIDFVLYSAPAIFHLNTGHRHANSQAVI